MNENTEQNPRRRRRRFPRLRWSTWVLLVLLTSAAVAVNWPVEYSSRQMTSLSRLALVGPSQMDEPLRPNVHGGVPFRYYSRTGNLLPLRLLHLPPCVNWSSAALVGDIVVAVAFILLVAAWWEGRRRRKQRWLQLSLADVALAILLLAIPAAWDGHHRRRYVRERQFEAKPNVSVRDSSREAPWWIAKVVPYDRLWPFQTIRAVDCVSPDAKTMRELSRLRGLQVLTLSGDYSAKDLRHVSGLPMLRRLDLRDEAPNSEVLQVVAEMQQLQSLTVSGNSVTSQSLEPLHKLKKLYELDLRNAGAIDDSAFLHIGRIFSLGSLRLPADSLDGSGLVHLHGHPNLQILELDTRRSPTDQPWLDIDLRSLRRLERLYIGKRCRRVHLEDLPKLEALPSPRKEPPFIREVILPFTDYQLTAEHIFLQNLPELQSVCLTGSQLKTLHVAETPTLRELRVFPESGIARYAFSSKHWASKKDAYPLAPGVCKVIGDIDSLRSLELPAAILSDEDVAALGRRRSLQRLSLDGCGISDHAMRHLSGLTELRELELQRTEIGDEGWARLPRMERLERLILDHSRIRHLSLEGLSCLVQLSTGGMQLKSLHLDDLPALEGTLSLGDPALKDVRIVSAPRLERFYLDGSSCDSLHLEGVDGLHVLNMRDSTVTDCDLEQVASCAGITYLQLKGTGVTDTCLRNVVSKFTALESLGLEDTRVTDDGLKALGHLKKLDSPDLGGTAVTDLGLETVGGMTAMESLYLSRTKIEGPGLQHLSGLRFLRELLLGGTQVDSDSVKHLTGLSLDFLELSDTEIDDRAFPSIASLTMLEHLYVDGCNVTRAGLKQLAPLAELRGVDARDTKVAKDDFRWEKWNVETGPRP